MSADAYASSVVRLTDELWAYWAQEPSAVQALLCERGDEAGWVQVVAPPQKRRWLQPTDLELFVANPPDDVDSPTWREGVPALLARGWEGDASAPLIRARPVPDGRTPQLARWAVDELLLALELGHGVTDVDELRWTFG